MTQQQLITPINPDTFENTAQRIMGCDLDLTIREVEQAIEVSITPGKMVTIQSRAYDNYYAEVELMPDGQISFSSNRIVHGRFYLPNPAMLGAEKLTEKTSLQSHVYYVAEQIMTHNIARQLNITLNTNNRQTITRATKKVARYRNLQTLWKIQGKHLIKQFQDEVRQLLDEAAWQLASNSIGQVTVDRYNRAVVNKPAIQELAKTNPGATAWMLNQPSNEKYNHPGQIIEKVKPSLLKAGLESRHWKATVHTPQEAFEPILQKYIPKYAAAIILNGCGDAGQTPTTEHTAVARDLFIRCRRLHAINAPKRNEEPVQAIARNNLRRVVAVIVKSSTPDAAAFTTENDVNELGDYLDMCFAQEQPVTAKTYGGLMKAVHRWQSRLRQLRAEAQIQRELDQRDGWLPAWNSLVDEFEAPQDEDTLIRIVPLINAADLIHEGSNMQHCVGTYYRHCVEGRTRIFSIRQGEYTLATTEISRNNGRWQSVQTRARNNQPPVDAARKAAQLTAAQYNTAWSAASAQEPHPHSDWMIKPNTGETKPSLRHIRRDGK